MATTLTNTGITFPDATTQTTAAAAAFASGTAMIFQQTAAPTGWTKSTTHDNKALRLINGTVGTGGSSAFTTAFGTPSVSGSISGTVGATTLTTTQMPSHTHSVLKYTPYGGTFASYFSQIDGYNGGTGSRQTNATGGGGSHDHSFSGSLSSATASINVQYVDVIIATKD